MYKVRPSQKKISLERPLLGDDVVSKDILTSVDKPSHLSDQDAEISAICSVIILIPLYNDWDAVKLLIHSLDDVLLRGEIQADILIVDDGSTYPMSECDWRGQRFCAIKTIEILELARNLGHQRAIAVGLAHIHDKKVSTAIVIMDADGEDNPDDVPKLVNQFNLQGGEKIVFAQRAKRSEGNLFKSFYYVYKNVYWLLTGYKVRFGNFSIIPCSLLPKLVVTSEIWNHYAAGVMKARIPYTEISANRSIRLAGHSRMNFVSLVIHGLGAVSVHSDVIGVRALVVMLLLVLASVAGGSVVVLIRLLTNLAIPGWASFITLLFMLLLMQSLMIAAIFVFIILNSRSNVGFIPRRDYKYFALAVKQVYSQQ